MKKIFTLISLVCFAMGVSAQTESYSPVTWTVDADGKYTYTLASEFAAVVGADGNATNEADGKSVVKFSTANVDVEAVGGTTPKDDAITPGTVIDEEKQLYEVASISGWNTITWKNDKNKVINVEGGDPVVFAILMGTGNPYVDIMAEQIITDGSPTGRYRAAYTYYQPDGSKGMPLTGLYYKFTPKVNGTLKIAVWANKGHRNTYVVEESTKKAIEYTAEGYMANNTFQDAATLKASHDAAYVKEGVDSNPYVIGDGGGKVFHGWITFVVEAGKSYWLLQDSSQIGFGGFEFTAGEAGINDITTDVDKNAPKYNLAGQRVDKNYKGVVIQNGKKFMNK